MSIPPFPDDIPVAPLVTVSLSKLLENPASKEHERLFAAAKDLGFFYLDMQNTTDGESLLKEAGNLFNLMTDFFNLPLEEKQKYDFAAKRMYFGYKGKGREILDAKGNLDINEQYNVGKSQPHAECRLTLY